MVTEDDILNCLAFVIEPDLKKDIIDAGLVYDLRVENNDVSFAVKVHNPAMHSRKRMEDACIHQIQKKFPETSITVVVTPLEKNKERDVQHRSILPGVKNVIAIASGKGGVGKSTVCANLAVEMASRGYKVGLVDADIYGPSIHMMFDVVAEKPGVKQTEGSSMMLPVENYGVKIMSIGFFAGANQAVAWRGPMATKALTQMFKDVYWGDLDYLFIDLPPGTGDIHLSLVQNLPLDGVVIVTTPQEVALADARKGIAMFRLPAINKKVIGIIENMAWFTPEELPENKYYIFGKGGAVKLSEQYNIPSLGQIPLIQSVREAGDVGRPVVLQRTGQGYEAVKLICSKFEAEMLLTQEEIA